MFRRSLSFALLLLIALPTVGHARQGPASDFDAEFKKGVDALIAHKFPEGMAAMRHCLELRPKATACAYNLACGHALQGEIDPGVEWFGKFVEWGGGNDVAENMIDLATKDPDLDGLRKDPRFVALFDKMLAYKKAIDDYVATPAVYVPERIAKAAELPVLVVLHASGSTKDAVVTGPWKKVADELGCALIAPSARVPIANDPKLGMAWFGDPEGYLVPARTYALDKSVNQSLDSFKKDHKLDRARVLIAGEGDGAVVALRVGLSSPSLYKGIVAHDIVLFRGLSKVIQDKAQNAVKAGQKVRVFVDSERVAKMLAESPAKLDAAKVIDDWKAQLSTCGFQDPLAVYAADKKDDAQATKLALPVLVSMMTKPTEAPAPK